MAQTAALVDVLKRELRARGVTYAQVARNLKLSEASVKRMFSKRDFTLKRLDRICELTHAEFSDLARILHEEETLRLAAHVGAGARDRLRPQAVPGRGVRPEPRDLRADRRRLRHLAAECIQLLVRLDRLGFIQLQPNNRIKLLVSHDFLVAAGRTDTALLQRAGAQRVFPLALRPARTSTWSS